MFEATATWGPSKPLSELQRLIEQRCHVLHETAKDAAIATVINAAASLRAQTRKAKPSAKTKPDIASETNIVPSWTMHGGARRRCLRDASGKRIGSGGLRTVYLGHGSGTQAFLVKPEHKRDKQYLVIARNRGEVEKYEQARSKRRKEALGGLAKFTLGLAMAKLSTRNKPGEAGGMVSGIAPKFASASAQGEGKALSVELRSALDYAVLALKDGKGSIDTAMMKAANKTFGLLSRTMQNWVSPVDIGPCPFPELVGKRSAK